MSLHPCHDRQSATPAAAFCEVCQTITPTRLIPLSGGIGNCCAVCRTCRKGRPYVSRREYQNSLTPGRADGGNGAFPIHRITR